MKKFLMCFAVALMTLVGLSSCERVDAGHEGILVELYGSDKGSVPSVLTGGGTQTFLDISKLK